MATKHSPAPAASKLPKFLQKQSRDRARTTTDLPDSASPASSSTSSTLDASAAAVSPTTPSSSKIRKGSRFLGRKDRPFLPPPEDARQPPDVDDAPVIVEPVSIPRPRTQQQQQQQQQQHQPTTTSAPDALHALLYPSASTAATAPSSSRIGDLPTRLSGWFSHTFSSSSTDLSLPNLLAQSSPRSKANAFLTAAKHGKGHLDKAMRYILDSDATPDKCTDPIWLLGVQHPGYEPPSPISPQLSASQQHHHQHYPNAVPHGLRRGSGSPPSFRSSTSSVASNAELALSLSQSSSISSSTSSSAAAKHNPAAHWPPVFYIDFLSRIWLTYRSHFPLPIKDTQLADLCGEMPAGDLSPAAPPAPTSSSSSPVKNRWHWVGGEKTWSSDSGWGCMLRTGQSLLANALIHVYLGREWRKPPYPVYTADYATYVQILTWFLDTPLPEAPFSVHRMALAGKELGTDVGQWFGPSVAAGAIKRLVHAFPGAGLGVSVAKDGVLSQTDVYAASYTDPNPTTVRSPKKNAAAAARSMQWGDRPVLVLIGLRLGIDGVNPIYYETIKALFTFPQSVGIAGGRPSSSYYFVGSQADNLFYLDPHNPRMAVPLRSPPPEVFSSSSSLAMSASSPIPIRRPTPELISEREKEKRVMMMMRNGSSQGHSDMELGELGVLPVSPTGKTRPIPVSVVPSQSSSGTGTSASNDKSSGGLDALQEHYVSAYSAAELKTYHCERVRKMPLGGLDPSMLIGFLCRDEEDWGDLKKRVEELPKSIFAIQNEHPNWSMADLEDAMELESMSEPEELDMDLEDEEKRGESDDDDDNDEEEEEEYYEAGSNSTSSHGRRRGDTGTSEGDTEEDPVEALTPGPQARFDLGAKGKKLEPEGGDGEPEDGDGESDIEDGWVDSGDPGVLTPMQGSAIGVPGGDVPSLEPPPPVYKGGRAHVHSEGGVEREREKKKERSTTSSSSKPKRQMPVPVPLVRLPTQPQQQQESYPFPGSGDVDSEPEEGGGMMRGGGGGGPGSGPGTRSWERGRYESQSWAGPPSGVASGGNSTTSGSGSGFTGRMFKGKGRDGGRTQSGGVKGILTDG